MTGDTLLHRQVSPSWVQLGRVTSQAFRPTPKDEKLLSVYNGDMITPRSSWDHFTGTLRRLSAGVMSVTVGECAHQELPAASDPMPFPEHAVIDFTGFAENEIKKKAKHLRAAAEHRGWQYQAEGIS